MGGSHAPVLEHPLAIMEGGTHFFSGIIIGFSDCNSFVKVHLFYSLMTASYFEGLDLILLAPQLQEAVI